MNTDRLLKLISMIAALFASVGAGAASGFNQYEPMLPRQLSHLPERQDKTSQSL